jgi:hypothetical protein
MGISNIASNLRPGICTSSTRPTTPYEGQVIYETDTNRVLVYDSAAWVMIADTDQPPGLQLIKTDTITSGTSKEITSIFSSEFTNYQIVVDNVKMSGANNLFMRLGTTSTGYYVSGLYVQYGTGNPVSADAYSTNTSLFATGCIADSTGHGSAIIHVMNPNDASRTGFISQGVDARTAGGGGRNYTGYLDNTTSYTSVTFLTNAATTFTTCNISVYGYRK